MSKRIVAALSVFMALAVFGVVPRVHADVNDFVIDKLEANYYISTDDAQGRMRIVERFDVQFSDNNHGILRAIPTSYAGQSLRLHVNQITSSTNAPTGYTTYSSNGNTVLKIGDPNRTITGKQRYTIDYSVENVIKFGDNTDRLIWDINGDQWQQTFSSVTATFHMPEGVRVAQKDCFTGAYGRVDKQCTAEGSEQTYVFRSSVPLSAGQTLTAELYVAKGVFVAPTRKDWWMDNGKYVAMVAVPPLLAGVWAFRRWWRHGKDIKGRGVVVPEYTPPKGLSVMEAAVVRDYRLDAKEVTAVIIDLAVRGYLVIVEEKKVRKFAPDSTEYVLKRTNKNVASLTSAERKLLDWLCLAGSEVRLSSLKGTFYMHIQDLQRSVPLELTQQDYFVYNPRTAGNTLHIVATILLIASFIFRSWLSVGFILAAVIIEIVAIFMPKRTTKGVAIKEHLDGLELYIRTAEKDRIQLLEAPNARYAKPNSGPKHSVELFESLLPYAMLFGLEKQWAQEFKDIYTTPPNWYNGNWNSFNAIYLTNSLSHTASTMNASFAPPSGSGSGGFSGGGGGGGGGGGW